MHHHNRPVFALLALAATVAFAPLPAIAEDSKPREATIIVSGEGEAALAPDMAVLSLGVVSQAPAAADALSANNAAMAKVLADLKADGLAERDLQTSNFTVMPQYRPIPDGESSETGPEIIGYTVQNTLTVRLRDLSKLGALIDRSIKLGVNQGGDIAFTNDEPEAAISEARKEAVADALAKARTLTEAAGVRLGRIIEISENYSRPMPQTLYRAAMAKEMADAAPVASGENSYSVTVNVTFAIEQ